MSHILYITANPKTVDQSFSLAAAEAVTTYQEAHPEDTIEKLDLYTSNINFLSADNLTKMGTTEESVMRTHAEKFAAADRYIIAAPMWNFSVPAILKAYIDYVSFAGITFKYTETGPIGLLAPMNKKMMFISASAGSYTDEATRGYNYCGTYMRAVVGFLGITDFEEICISNTVVAPNKEGAIQDARSRALAW